MWVLSFDWPLTLFNWGVKTKTLSKSHRIRFEEAKSTLHPKMVVLLSSVEPNGLLTGLKEPPY